MSANVRREERRAYLIESGEILERLHWRPIRLLERATLNADPEAIP